MTEARVLVRQVRRLLVSGMAEAAALTVVRSSAFAALYSVFSFSALLLAVSVVENLGNVPPGSDLAGTTLGLQLPAILDAPGGRTIAALAAAGGLVLAAAASILLTALDAAGPMLLVALPMGMVSGVAGGLLVRVITAPTWDANIGGGIALFFGVPAMLPLWALGLILAIAGSGGTRPA